MSAPLKSACAAGLLLIAGLGPSTLAQSGVIFQDGWEGGVGTGCSETTITDNRAWNEFGPSNTCTVSPPVAEVVTDEKFQGTSSLRINFTPNGAANGPDFRIVRAWGTNYSQIFARWYIKYSDNWVWANGDHKVAIFGVGNQGSQDIYFNIRGNGGGPSGRITIGVTPTDTVYSDPNVEIRPGAWYLFEVHIVSGANGLVEVKVNDQLLRLQQEAGATRVDIGNLNTGSGLGFIKLDTTYNAYSYPSSRGLFMSTWYDSVAVSTTGWLGGTPAGGGPTPPPVNAPSAPNNLRIVR